MLVKEDVEIKENKMVSLEQETDDSEIIINKRLHRQIVGNVKDDRLGSMMPVVLEQMVDRTKSKVTAWLGMERMF